MGCLLLIIVSICVGVRFGSWFGWMLLLFGLAVSALASEKEA